MKIDSLIDYLGYIAVKIASFFFRLFPISIGLFFARRIGWLIYYLNRKRRCVAYRNLKAAFGSETSSKDIKRIMKRMYQNLVQMLIEILTLPRANKIYMNKFIKIDGIENIENAKNKGKGIIFLTGHFGNWELSSLAGALKGYSMMVLAREQKHSRLNDLLNSYRELTGCKVIKKGFAVKEILASLRNNGMVGILVDQDAGKNGVFVDFFGRKTSSAPGPMSFALKTGATILPTFIIREKGPYHKIIVNKPLEVDRTLNEDDAVKDGLQKFAAILESYIIKYPEQWLWVHKRWKSTPTKKILILNDGKAGHLNQSLAVADIIQKHRKEAQFSIVGINFKNKILKTLFDVNASFSGRHCQGCMRCLKFCLKKSSYDKLMKEYADIIISCGASLERVNLLMSKELDAKNILIMKPSIIGTNRFSLVIAPRHDRLKEKPNIVITEGAPTRITEERLKKDSSTLASRFKFEKEAKIGILVGGDNSEFRLTTQIIHEVIDNIIEAACQIDAEILVTTSRRTSKEAEKILKKRLGEHMRCKLLVIANESNIPEAVGGILGLCKIIVVSCESVSMISEALNSSNYTFVFELEKRKKGLLKHELFLKNLIKNNHIKLVKAADLSDEIIEIWKEKPPIKKLDDNHLIYEGLNIVL